MRSPATSLLDTLPRPAALDPAAPLARAIRRAPAGAEEPAASAEEQPVAGGLFAEFRRKLATGEAMSRALLRLAQALRFSGRITLTFHQGRLTKTVLEESYFGGDPAA